MKTCIVLAILVAAISAFVVPTLTASSTRAQERCDAGWTQKTGVICN